MKPTIGTTTVRFMGQGTKVREEKTRERIEKYCEKSVGSVRKNLRFEKEVVSDTTKHNHRRVSGGCVCDVAVASDVTGGVL